MSTLWKLYDMVLTARMKVCTRVDPSMSTASKGVDARHNLHLAVDLVALQSSRGACLLQGVQDMERGFPTCERADVSLAHRRRGVAAKIVEARAACHADVRVVIKVAPGFWAWTMAARHHGEKFSAVWAGQPGTTARLLVASPRVEGVRQGQWPASLKPVLRGPASLACEPA